jgi:hypothetical protein
MIILLVQQRFAQPQFMQHRFVGVALSVFFQDRFSNHFHRHLLLDGQVGCVREPAVVIHR